MGTDIHLIVEQKKNGKWERIDPPASYPRNPWVLNQIEELKNKLTEQDLSDPDGMYVYYCEKRDRDWYSHRNYRVFSILADVRNGSGFAGVKTGEKFVPISEPKGFPLDCSCYNGDEIPKDDREPFNFGYHDFSWLTVKELTEYNWEQTVNNCGAISWEEFVQRQETGFNGEPNSWSGGIWSDDIVVIEEEEAKKQYIAKDNVCTRRYVRVWWNQTYKEATYDFYENFVLYLASLDENPENVRIVFGFDS